jgi:hypothetical protein
MDFDEKEDRIEEFNLEAFKDYAKDEEKSINPDEEAYDELLENDFELWFEQARESILIDFIQTLSFDRIVDKFEDEFKEYAKLRWKSNV